MFNAGDIVRLKPEYQKESRGMIPHDDQKMRVKCVHDQDPACILVEIVCESGGLAYREEMLELVTS